ncbi:AraC family transcriptional regulator [Sphingomonas sp. PP-CC-3G-468]|uniref:AraC family transcriptional regulator n=1 Tax=Sphingomonas sp. PP-CC-3G-468 TaxID=2135656 RepID=UPI0010436D75|nr:AraC family transcriptional regulator [Sphingomonas sp. PP-CC-3G-468]TCM07436.1 AraC-like DNA-binding protein [Sphingomonas sp. PP-CC-3G-468]
MTADILSDVLSVLTPVTPVAGGLDLGGDWAVSFPAHEGLKFFAIVAGRAWLRVEGDPDPILLEEDDCVILPAGRQFVLARDLTSSPISIETIPETDWHQRVAIIGGGDDTMLLGGHFAFTGLQMDLLLGGKPPILRLREEADRNHLRWALERTRAELTEARPGSALVVRHLAHLLLVQVLRIYIVSGVGRATGWLFALADPKIGRATQAIHSAPSDAWTLTRLAAEAGMSRSKFAERFRALTGTSPIDYLIRWRMLLACRHLASGHDSVSKIATGLGYRSEAAFSTAFKRVMGCAPRRYRTTSA